MWPVWLAAAIVAAALALFLASRRGWHKWALQHRLLTSGVLAIALAVGIPAGWYAISPLFERETVCEASPIAGAGAGSEKCQGVAVAAGGMASAATATAIARTATPAATAMPEASHGATEAPQFQPRVASQGEFRGADDFHFGRGQALLIETAPGEYTLRFENFSVRNGPDLFVYLSTDPNDRAISGSSSGGNASFNAAWTRPDVFHRVLSFIGGFTNLRGDHIYPSLVRKMETKPLLVFLQDGLVQVLWRRIVKESRMECFSRHCMG